MPTEHQAPPDETPKLAPQLQNAGRRRIARAGIGAAGVLLTLESKVAMATGPKCVAPSAASLSHGGNSNYVQRGRCNAIGPEDWVRLAYFWPCSKDIEFGAIFKCKGRDVQFARVKLIKILGEHKYRNFVGRAVATTYLNIVTGKLSVMNEETLFKMWYDLQTRQTYSPTPKVVWTPYDVRKYLESTYRA